VMEQVKHPDRPMLGIILRSRVVVIHCACRYPPYFDDQPFGIYEKILNGKIEWPKHVDPIARYV